MDYTRLIEGILTIVMVVLTGCVIPWIKTKISTDKLAQIMKFIDIGVRAAEQIFDENQGSQKKSWVMGWLVDNGITLDSDAMSAMVESAVNELHNELKA